ncbi:HNH endonuclease [Burkholderia multivorans]|uniref:HNH endonuclease n=1 Tax=Burkholderia multivorans TaxID=87883 RepID=UPI001C25FC39|nr:HNH endonuclease [Burkholderia multivorans]
MDGKACEGVFFVRADDVARWLLLIDWKKTGNYYIVIFPESRLGPICELHKLLAHASIPTLEWTYPPSKRDGKNEQRRAYFLATYGSETTTLILPQTAAQIDNFVDDLFELAEYRLKADALAENVPPAREWALEGFPEGRRLYRLHSTRERNPQLIREAKEIAMRRDGCLRCSCCGFDFNEAYGEIGHGYIEAHHTMPLSSLEDDGDIVRVEDLALVCANCHRMLHRRRPWLAREDLAQLLKG